MTDVVLCAAPVLSAVRPSLGLGLLQAAAGEAGIEATSLYLNLAFAERIGVDLNEELADGPLPTILLAGDWLFAEALRGARTSDAIAEHERRLREVAGDELWEQLCEVRKLVPGFLAEAAERILDLRPRLVGFSTLFEQTAASLALAAEVKRRDPGVTTCIGGANCHGPMGRVILEQFPQIDYVFTGEADASFPRFAANLLAGRRLLSEDPDVIGRGLESHGDYLYIEDMDALPIPAYHDYFDQLAAMQFVSRVRPAVLFESSRGCWWGQKRHCTFCGLNALGMTHRSKSAARVLAEIDELERRHGTYRFQATDNIMDRGHMLTVFGKLASQGGGRRFFYEIKANITEPQLAQLAAAGVTWLQPGIESLADEVLKIMRKGTTRMVNLRLLRNAREVGVGLAWAILHGFPGEPATAYHEMAELVPLVEHLQAPMGCSPIRVDRFSPNFEQSAELGWSNLTPANAYTAIYCLPPAAVADMAYFFTADAEGAVSDEDVAPLKAEVRRWKSRWVDEPLVPQLEMAEVEGIVALKDTRSIASQTWRRLTDEELAVLRAFRSPSKAERTLREHAAATGSDPGEITAVFDRLVSWGLLHVERGRAISLVVESERRVVEPGALDDPPWGYLVPAGAPAAADGAPERENLVSIS